MAKKKGPAKKSAADARRRGAAPAKRKTAPKPKPARPRGNTPRRRTPVDQSLPGMENRRIAPLDEICHSIADARSQINDLKADEAGFEQTALGLMRQHRKTTWRAHGVELVRVPGEEKLRVRTTRGGAATAEVEDESEIDAGDADTPDEGGDASEGRGDEGDAGDWPDEGDE